MKRWAWLVAGLYFLALVALTAPVVMTAFAPKLGIKELADVFVAWPYWVWVCVMVLSQIALLAVPVRIASRRPVSRRKLIWPVLVGGLMMGAMATGAVYALFEAAFGLEKGLKWVGYAGIGAGLLVWAFWAVVFHRQGKGAEAKDVVSRQCRKMLKGSILELLIAVPTHVVARSRDECCGGIMTFVGLAFGISVMLFSFGPSVFFLYAERWNRLRPK
jgi:hypothetical protein